MNKFKKISLLIAGGLVFYIGVVTYVHYEDKVLTHSKLSGIISEEMSPLDLQAYLLMVDNGCQYCHSQNSALPFYANFPIAKQLMKEDIRQGVRHFQIEPMLSAMRKDSPISEVDLAKIEGVMKNQSMPPPLYLTMHWGSNMDEQERKRILDWIKQTRQAQHEDSPAVAEFKNETIQPIYSLFAIEPDKSALGEKLYHDTRLSGDNTLSCASCHNLAGGGDDNLDTSIGVAGAIGPINAPTVFNAVYNTHQFWDGRAKNLQDQAAGPPLNPGEMASLSWIQIIDKLSKDAPLKAQFLALYPEGISQHSITDAIAEFEKTLTTPNSPFDRFLKGDNDALTEKEKEGYALFKASNCGTCHSGEAMGGSGFEVLGLKEDYFADGNITEVDKGRFNVTQNALDMHRFKVPTLRNIALTAPYFHDAKAKTLEEAIELMATYQTSTDLSKEDISKIAAYLRTLTGEYKGKSLALAK